MWVTYDKPDEINKHMTVAGRHNLSAEYTEGWGRLTAWLYSRALLLCKLLLLLLLLCLC